MRAERVVFDSNVLISAVLLPGRPFRVLEWVLENGFLIFSDASFAELASRLQRPKFDRYVSLERRRELLADLEAVADWTAITGSLQVCRDPDDDKVLETALAGRANRLVSGDGDLLDLDPYEGLAIVTPAQFLDNFTV